MQENTCFASFLPPGTLLDSQRNRLETLPLISAAVHCRYNHFLSRRVDPSAAIWPQPICELLKLSAINVAAKSNTESQHCMGHHVCRTCTVFSYCHSCFPSLPPLETGHLVSLKTLCGCSSDVSLPFFTKDKGIKNSNLL